MRLSLIAEAEIHWSPLRVNKAGDRMGFQRRYSQLFIPKREQWTELEMNFQPDSIVSWWLLAVRERRLTRRSMYSESEHYSRLRLLTGSLCNSVGRWHLVKVLWSPKITTPLVLECLKAGALNKWIESNLLIKNHQNMFQRFIKIQFFWKHDYSMSTGVTYWETDNVNVEKKNQKISL